MSTNPFVDATPRFLVQPVADDGMLAAAKRIQQGHLFQAQNLTEKQARAELLREERDALREGWDALVSSNSYAEIARRAGRLNEIAQELVRIGQ